VPQFDLFSAPGSNVNLLLDLKIVMPGTCPKCRCGVAIIGPGKGPHAASLTCAGCRRHRGWLAKPEADFIREIIRAVGRPTTPIVLRNASPPAPGAASSEAHNQRADEKQQCLL
jgi:hypothetical protein